MKSILYVSPIALALIVLSALASAGCGTSDQSTRRASQPPPPAVATPPLSATNVKDPLLDVPYVPTPTKVVAKMLEMAKVDQNDLLYDLGSGDGRIVITAAQKYGARGVGYDLNPQRIQESNDNARRAGVTDRVRFTQQDLFEADLSGATVVTLYLLPDVNLKLRPKLLRELKAGTRVVSHNYPMGDWKEEEIVELEVDGEKHYIYSWIVPSGGRYPSKSCACPKRRPGTRPKSCVLRNRAHDH